MSIIENGQKFSNGFVNCYLIHGKTGVILVDCGFKSFSKRLTAAIKQARRNEFLQIWILVTHADADHVGALKKLGLIFNANIHTSELEGNAIKNGCSSRQMKPSNLLERLFVILSKPLFVFEPVNSLRSIEYGQLSIAGEQVIAIDSKGHTPGHVSYYFPEKKILFAGDSIQIIRGKPYPSSGMNTWNVDLAKESFYRQMQLEPIMIAAGHGLIKRQNY